MTQGVSMLRHVQYKLLTLGTIFLSTVSAATPTTVDSLAEHPGEPLRLTANGSRTLARTAPTVSASVTMYPLGASDGPNALAGVEFNVTASDATFLDLCIDNDRTTITQVNDEGEIRHDVYANLTGSPLLKLVTGKYLCFSGTSQKTEVPSISLGIDTTNLTYGVYDVSFTGYVYYL